MPGALSARQAAAHHGQYLDLPKSNCPHSRINQQFFLTDDLGWNSPGFHNPNVISPTLDALHANGVELVDHHGGIGIGALMQF